MSPFPVDAFGAPMEIEMAHFSLREPTLQAEERLLEAVLQTPVTALSLLCDQGRVVVHVDARNDPISNDLCFSNFC